MKRIFNQNEPELMDRQQPVSAELEKDLQNIASLNRYFGSHRLVRRFLAAWLKRDRTYRVLDLCTGFGDIPRMMVDWGRRRGVRLRIDAVDANGATIEIARAHSADYCEIEFQRGNVLTYESRETYDLVCCSLALHHFNEVDAVRLLRHCRELSHRFVLVADLVREVTTSVGVWALTQFVYREPMTRHDGRVSAQRAFSFAEMRELAESAGWKDFGHARFLFCKQALWLDARDLAEIPGNAVPANVALPSPA
jgi:2-polyprenyl-3-methyl-5-hydroxy-6-metoxy-1,4-benzoquinol methylase